MAVMTANLKFKKLSSSAKEPSRERDSDAGIDLYSVKKVRIPSGGREIIPTGYAVQIPEGYYGQIEERSGFSTRNTLKLKAGVIDSEYRGEIGVVFQNCGFYPEDIEMGDKIAQLIIHRQPKVTFVFVDELDQTTRGEKGFGSSDEKNK
jgi:dUTP pyrophosphatase